MFLVERRASGGTSLDSADVLGAPMLDLERDSASRSDLTSTADERSEAQLSRRRGRCVSLPRAVPQRLRRGPSRSGPDREDCLSLRILHISARPISSIISITWACDRSAAGEI